jgi:leucyl-tRNA synthetase
MSSYNPKFIEDKWRSYWEENRIFKTSQTPKKKYYVLEMFAYPSGDIHMGHFRNYTIGDVVARYRMMRGYDVLHPFGWDAFGMPAEQAAIEHNLHPRQWTLRNISISRTTLQELGISYDWDREVITCMPEYYRWTQWVFLQLFKQGLAYQSPASVNWCPQCQTVLANEQAQEGKCWRCECLVTKKELDRCWFLRYTHYAERLLKDLDRLDQWPENVKTMQRNWIGKSEGCEIEFRVEGSGERLPVFTTRPDTIFGVTFMAIAPEHPLLPTLLKDPSYQQEVERYIQKAMQKMEIERTALGEKDGVFTGRYVINPVSGERVQLWVADYVLATYGTGVVMGVPGHDQRDFMFAKRYNLPIKIVIQPKDSTLSIETMQQAYVDPGIMVNSCMFNGLGSIEGARRVCEYVARKGLGKAKVNYKLKDWLISRQRYWGAPIPILYCERCGVQGVPEDQLPVLLPQDVREYIPKGRSPLADLKGFADATCPMCSGPAQRDVDTMDTFMCSSFYLFRYTDPHNQRVPWDKEELKKWLPVDIYIGGVEHACMHLLYFRFITKALYDAGWLNVDEPVIRLYNHGMVLDAQGQVMSKSRGNVISPSEIIKEWGVDTSRIAMLFFAPSDCEIRWNKRGLIGARRFLERLWTTVLELGSKTSDRRHVNLERLSAPFRALWRKLHQVINRVTDSMEGNLHFNTSISAIMELINLARSHPLVPQNEDEQAVMRGIAEDITLMIAPMAPFIAEELWEKLGCLSSIFKAPWPAYSLEAAAPEEVQIIIQLNGKLKGRLYAPAGLSKDQLYQYVLSQEVTRKILQDRSLEKVIVIPDRLVNFVIK